MSNFVGLHVHSEYSLLDGASQLPNLIDQAVELGMEAIALTDHGVMYGAIELIKICRSRGIKPIVGNEMYAEFTWNRLTLRHEAEQLGIRPNSSEVTALVKTLPRFK